MNPLMLSPAKRYAASHAVGRLSRTNDDLYRFRYLDGVSSLPGFRPFLGFSDLDRN
jgi:hypothetical protein